MKLAGLMLDVVDDPEGVVFKSRFPTMDSVPPIMKVGKVLSHEERGGLPDDSFGLVLIDGGQKFRKYAMVDPANTAVSVMYFLENRHMFPEEAAKTAAVRLTGACVQHGIEPPAPLLATAAEKLAYLWPGSALRQLTEKKTSGAECAPSPSAEKAFAEYFIDDDLKQQAAALDEQDSALGLQRDELQLKEDEIRLQGKRLEMQQVSRSRAQQMAQPTPAQTQAVSPYVDTSGQQAAPPEASIKSAAAKDCLLIINGTPWGPVRNYQEIEKAAQYFAQWADRFTPVQRREYCVKLAAKAHPLGIALPELVEKYAGVELDPYRQAYIDIRVEALGNDPDAAHMYGSLSKVAHITDPNVMVEALEQLDDFYGLSQHYDNGIPDPYFTLFGMSKTAGQQLADMWRWESEIGDSINENELADLLGNSAKIRTMRGQFDDAFVDGLIKAKNPQQVFDSLPDTTKTIIARLAAPNTSHGN